MFASASANVATAPLKVPPSVAVMFVSAAVMPAVATLADPEALAVPPPGPVMATLIGWLPAVWKVWPATTEYCPCPSALIVPTLVVPSSQVTVADNCEAGVVVLESASVMVATLPLKAVPSVALTWESAAVSPAVATVADPLADVLPPPGPVTLTLNAEASRLMECV